MPGSPRQGTTDDRESGQFRATRQFRAWLLVGAGDSVTVKVWPPVVSLVATPAVASAPLLSVALLFPVRSALPPCPSQRCQLVPP
jgi:hypothetical protein